jgi:hypothetical protein
MFVINADWFLQGDWWTAGILGHSSSPLRWQQKAARGAAAKSWGKIAI